MKEKNKIFTNQHVNESEEKETLPIAKFHLI